MKVNIVIGDVVWGLILAIIHRLIDSVNQKKQFYELMNKVVTSERVLFICLFIYLFNTF